MSNLKFEGGRRRKLYSAQLNAIAYSNKNSVLAGCEVTKTVSEDRDVTVASGRLFFGNDEIDVSEQTLSITANNLDTDRLDLVAINASGTASIIEGTASAIPATPDYDPETYIIVALVFARSNSLSILTADILDNRVLNVGGSGSGGGSFLRHIEEFTSQTTVTVTHNLGDDEPLVFAYDTSGDSLAISSVSITNVNELDVTFGSSSSGKIIVYGGTGVNNAYYTEDFTSQTTVNVAHNLNNRYVFVSVVDSDGKDVIPSEIERVDEDNVTVTFGTAQTGTVFIAGGISTSESNLIYRNKANYVISATDTSSNQALSLTNMYSITLTNTGNSTVYIKFDATATTADFPIYPERNITFENVDLTQISAICDTSETTTLRVLALAASKPGLLTNTEILSISSTDTSSSDTFANTTDNKDLIITNQSVADTYVDFDTTATTNDTLIKYQQYFILNETEFDSISAINNTSETATIKVLGLW